eukprot:2528920-Rhodomonas_salina.2
MASGAMCLRARYAMPGTDLQNAGHGWDCTVSVADGRCAIKSFGWSCYSSSPKLLPAGTQA